MARATLEATSDIKIDNQPNKTKHVVSGPPAPPTTTATADARADTTGKLQLPTLSSGTTCPMNHTQAEDQEHDIADLELADEGALLEGSTLSGNKTLMGQYPEDEANSKRTKKNNTGKEKKATPSTRNDGEQRTTGAR